jgi:hypothetical protein
MQATHILITTLQKRIAALTALQQQQTVPAKRAYYTRRINNAQKQLAKYLAY